MHVIMTEQVSVQQQCTYEGP